LSGKNTHPPPNQPIGFGRKVLNKAPDFDRNFWKQFTKQIINPGLQYAISSLNTN
jgi:hypothetical protein